MITPFIMHRPERSEGCYPGALAVHPEAEKGTEEEAEAERRAATPEALAKSLAFAIEKFEKQFSISPEEKLEPLRLVVKGLQPSKTTGNRMAKR